ncbi:MAG: helicase-related protein [Aerococcus sp.]|nr:helicase-related protein [Aerococcus sp.]
MTEEINQEKPFIETEAPSIEALQEQLYGRLVTARELGVDEEMLEQIIGIQSIPAIAKTKTGWQCQRCGNHYKKQFQLNFCCCDQKPCVYCLSCAQFGILRACDMLYTLPNPAVHPWQQPTSSLTWQGQRSPEQERASQEVCASFMKHADHLIWAVTGAGKTEIIFPVVDLAIQQGKRVAIATPRLDVCNELYPRFQEAFQGVQIGLLHSQSTEEMIYCALLICSTHQLVRFNQAFDLLIIDEIDAFPFHNDPMLHHVAKRALMATGSLVMLTATPDRALKRRSQQGILPTSLLPARYHCYPLPEPVHQLAMGWQTSIQRGQCPRTLKRIIQRWVARKQRFLIFMPHISLMQQLEDILHCTFPKHTFTSVSSKDAERLTKVEAMRLAQYDFLLTTTILERGVTFSAINVVVVGSEQAIFTQAALIQISGRVGRKKVAPTGEVIFLHEGRTQASVGAVKQIKQMNRIARAKHLLREEGA